MRFVVRVDRSSDGKGVEYEDVPARLELAAPPPEVALPTGVYLFASECLVPTKFSAEVTDYLFTAEKVGQATAWFEGNVSVPKIYNGTFRLHTRSACSTRQGCGLNFLKRYQDALDQTFVTVESRAGAQPPFQVRRADYVFPA